MPFLTARRQVRCFQGFINSPASTRRDEAKWHILGGVGGWLAAEEGFNPWGRLIEPLRRFWALGEERIILATALMHDLRKHVNAQLLGLSTCKAGALPTDLRPQVNLASDLQKHLLWTDGWHPRNPCRAPAFSLANKRS